MGQKFNKVKKHVKENKKVYLAAGIGAVVGAATVLIFTPRGIQIVDALKVQIKSPTTNNVIQMNLARRGHPGNIVVCKETGEAFASQNRAAAALDINPSQLAQHLRGKLPHVKGLTFEKVREAV